ncbi:hypothetical protein ACGFRG_17275 [Streptomyces sp. NPDC048696]|uniref:hypothetical protein n=1 Tax=Streptomyces sp. NPDC048696 TaxID=3365585 RepID=UPI0037148429
MDGREAVRMLGRRTALRYLALGTVSAAVSACTGAGAVEGPRKQALKAFVKGDWVYRSNRDHEGVLTVTPDGHWSVTQWGGLSGQWMLDGAVLSVSADLPTGDAEAEEQEAFTVSSMPEKVSGSFSELLTLTGGWSRVGSAVEAGYKKGALTLAFRGDGSEDLLVTCTRRK